MKRCPTTVALSLAVCLFAGSAHAQTVSYRRLALHNVVTRLMQTYGLDIVLKGSLLDKPNLPITFSVGDPDTTTTRLQIMNALANAAGVDFQKGFVVSKLGANETLPPVQVDTDAFVIFKSKTVPARDAIAIVAGSDNATVQIAPEVTGDVTLSSTTLRTSQAAREIAQQTQTVWRAYYALTPEDIMARSPHPFTYYDTTPPPAPASAPVAPTAPAVPTAPAPGTQVVTAPGLVAPGPFQYVPSMGYGSPYGGYGGYGGYGSPYNTGGYGSPYGGYGGYGGYSPYGGFGGGSTVTVLPGTGGYGPFGGYGGPPITFP